jgi:hypothetical protein
MMRCGGLLLAAVSLLPAGCDATDALSAQGASSPGDPGVVDSVRWPFWPTSMRVHPLSRVVTDRDRGRTVIEARIELVDGGGDTAKGYGQVRIDLQDASEAGSEVLVSWNSDLRDLALNEQHFDEVTRTYLFRLETEDALPSRPRLHVYFLSGDGARLEAELELRSR